MVTPWSATPSRRRSGRTPRLATRPTSQPAQGSGHPPGPRPEEGSEPRLSVSELQLQGGAFGLDVEAPGVLGASFVLEGGGAGLETGDVSFELSNAALEGRDGPPLPLARQRCPLERLVSPDQLDAVPVAETLGRDEVRIRDRAHGGDPQLDVNGIEIREPLQEMQEERQRVASSHHGEREHVELDDDEWVEAIKRSRRPVQDVGLVALDVDLHQIHAGQVLVVDEVVERGHPHPRLDGAGGGVGVARRGGVPTEERTPRCST